MQLAMISPIGRHRPTVQRESGSGRPAFCAVVSGAVVVRRRRRRGGRRGGSIARYYRFVVVSTSRGGWMVRSDKGYRFVCECGAAGV